MTPADFLAEILLPTVLEFRAEPRSRRHAYLAAIVTVALTDHLKKAGETGIEATMRAATGSAFDVVRGVANGDKHVRTDGRHVVAFAAGEDYDVPPSTFGSFVFGFSPFGDTVGGRAITTETGEWRADIHATTAATLRAFMAAYPARFPCNDPSVL